MAAAVTPDGAPVAINQVVEQYQREFQVRFAHKKAMSKLKQFAGAIRQHSPGPPRKFNRVQGSRCQRHCTPEGSGTRPSEAI